MMGGDEVGASECVVKMKEGIINRRVKRLIKKKELQREGGSSEGVYCLCVFVHSIIDLGREIIENHVAFSSDLK